MKKLFINLVGFATLVASFGVVIAQEPTISPEKKALIAELVAVSKADKQTEETMRAVFEQMDRGYPEMVRQFVEGRKDIPESEKPRIIEILEKQHSSQQDFRQRMLAMVDFQDYVNKAVYPLYDKFYSEAELADLVVFYKTSTGKKTIEIMPQLFAESVRLAQVILVPKLVEISNQVIREDIAKARLFLKKKPTRN